MKEVRILTGISGLITGAGRSRRFGKSTNKIFELVGDRPVIAHTISAFECCDKINDIVLVVGKDDVKAAEKIVGRFNFGKVKKIIAGGEHRQDSVRLGLQEICGDIVAIHDGARPMITPDIIAKSIDCALEYEACIVAVPVVDTIKSADAEGYVGATIDRSNLYAVQTPQTFKSDLIKKAHNLALQEGFYATDDAALVERLGKRVHIVQGLYDNIKITTQSDMDIAKTRLGGFQMRTGMGFDVHTLVEGRKLILGGVEIPFEKGLLGHSDADVLVHSIMDALLGAAGLGDIGRHFPDTSKEYKDADSLKLLIKVGNMLSDKGLSILNIDVTLVCQRPKISPYVNEMISNISDALQIDSSQVNIKATTTEGLGYTGKGEGIACYAIAAIAK